MRGMIPPKTKAEKAKRRRKRLAAISLLNIIVDFISN